MRILFIGGPTDEPGSPIFDADACRRIGWLIAEHGHELIVCSSFVDSGDRAVFDGFTKCPNPAKTLRIYAPACSSAITEWHRLLAERRLSSAPIEEITGPNADAPLTRSNAYLLAQLAALRTCDLVLALGGNIGGAALLLLAVAESQGVGILPFDFAGGAARDVLRRHRPAFTALLGDSKVDHLYDRVGIEHCIDLAERIRNPSRGRPAYVFLSHAWARPAETDLVEMELLRHAIPVFRDERKPQPGIDIPTQIRRELDSCTHFIGLWCTEYACSPHCYDEFHWIMERKQRDDSLKILMIRLDTTRWVWKEMREFGEKNFGPLDSDRPGLREALLRFLDR